MRLLAAIILTSLAFGNAASADTRIAFSDQVVGQKFDSKKPSARTSFITLNLSESYFSARCFTPKFTADKAGDLTQTIEWGVTGSSWYTPMNVHYKIVIRKRSDDSYVISSTIVNNGVTVTGNSLVQPNTPMLEIKNGTQFEANLIGENMDKIAITPVLTISTCK